MGEHGTTRRKLLVGAGSFGPLMAVGAGSAASEQSAEGFMLVKYKRAEPGTYPRTAAELLAVGGFDSGSGVSVHHWIDPELDAAVIARTNSVALQEMLQNALDHAPLGATLLLLNGDYRVTDTLVQRRYLHLQGAGATRLQGLIPDPRRNLYEVRLEAGPYGLGGDARGLCYEGMGFYLARGGHTAFLLDVTGPHGVPNLYVEAKRCGFYSPDSSDGYALHVRGLVTQGHLIIGNEITNGVFLDGCADGVTLEKNVIGGNKTGIVLDIAAGGFQTNIIRNLIVCRDGAIHIRNGSQVHIQQNQMEQRGINVAPIRTHVLVAPEDYVAKSIRIQQNSFGAGSNIDHSIVARGAAKAPVDGLLIDENVFHASARGVDIALDGSEVRWTRIGPSNEVRGSRGGVAINAQGRAPSNAADPATLLGVRDAGLGTYGTWKPVELAPPFTVRNGAIVAFRKALDDTLTLRGIAEGGAAGDLLLKLPPGFRPSHETVRLTACGDSVATLRFQPDGRVLLQSRPQGGLDLGVTLPVTGRTFFDPGY